MDKLPFSVYDFFGYLGSGFLVLVALAAAFSGTDGWEDTPGTVVALLFLVLAYVTGHVVANVSAYLIETKFVRGGVLGTPTTNLFASVPNTRWQRVFPGYFRPLPESQRERILAKASDAGIDTPSEALFYHCFATVKARPGVQARLDTFLNLYGFARNTSLALFLAAVCLVAGSIAGTAHTGDVVSPGWWAAGCVVAAIGLLYRYLKFFRHYGVEVFISYAEA